jgi:AP2 domain-containing protein/HNH endonuclease
MRAPKGSRAIPLHDRYGAVRAYTLVDTADHAWASQYRWYLTSERYVRRSIEPNVKTYLHREILGLAIGDPRFVDHRNRDRLDNRRANLRVVTRAEQQQNLTAQRRGSGYRGVHQRKSSGRWVAQVHVGGKRVTLGTFDTPEEAAQVAADYRREHMPFSHETLAAGAPREANLSSRGGSSRFRGVVWNKRANRWMAYGSVGGKRKHLGYFEAEAEAARVAAAFRGEHGQ